MNNKILILDVHRGTTLTHKKLFENIGFKVKVFREHCYGVAKLDFRQKFSMGLYPNGYDIFYICYQKFRIYKFLSEHNLAPLISKFIKKDHSLIFNTIKNFSNTNEIFSNIDREKLNRLLETKYFREYFNQFDYIFCSFPPAIFEFAKIIADKYDKKLILNIGHRFNIWIKTPQSNQRIKKNLIKLSKSKKHILGVASEYDYRYVKHYLNLDLKKLYLKTFQIPLSKKIKPKKNTILIGPANGAQGAEELFNSSLFNKQYKLYCEKNNIKPKFIFKMIKEEFAHYEIEDLNDYFGFVIYPYSSFSISGLELYEYNLPYFYPSVEILKKDKPTDYILYPYWYCTEEQYRAMENDADDDDSPNNYSDKAQEKWLSYFSGYQHKNSIIFDDLDDLFAKVVRADKNFTTISEKMFLENKKQREELLRKWKKILG